jgi:hypothetical protein
MQRRVLRVDGDQLSAGGLGQRGHELAAHDERLLVGQGDIDALGERHDRGSEAGRADDRVQHQIGVGLGDKPHQPLGTASTSRPSTPHQREPPRRDPTARSCERRAYAPADQRVVRRARGEPDQLELAGGPRDDVERLRADGARGAEDEQPLHGALIVAGGPSAADKPSPRC